MKTATMPHRPVVLIADDDEDILELVKLRLSRSGYDVLTAADGGAALALARAASPDIAVLDVAMPVLDGLEVTRALRADEVTASLPILLLTAQAQEADVEHGLAAGADDYVVKPFSPEALAERVASLLRIAHEATRPAQGLRTVASR